MKSAVKRIGRKQDYISHSCENSILLICNCIAHVMPSPGSVYSMDVLNFPFISPFVSVFIGVIWTTLKVWLHRWASLSFSHLLQLLRQFMAPGYCFVRTWSFQQTSFKGQIVLLPKHLFHFPPLACVQASDKECISAFPGGLYSGGARWLGSRHHCRRWEVADRWRWGYEQPERPYWIPVTQHQSDVSQHTAQM